MTKAAGFLLFCSAVCLAQPKLTVQSASSRQVELTWSGLAGPAVVERRAAGGQYAALATVADGTAYRDAAIDAMGIYQYRVHAPAAGSPASNEVTAGPPPVGYSTVLATPKEFIARDAQASFAVSTVMELDPNGDPAFLYTVVDPEHKGATDTDAYFLHWDRAHWRWGAPVRVGRFTPTRAGVSLARDPRSALWATVLEEEYDLQLFISADDGATWQRKHEIREPDRTLLGRAVALAGGRLYWVYGIASEGPFLLTGEAAGDPAGWKRETLPVPAPYERGSASSSYSVAVDSQGKPAVTYFGYGPDYNVTALYWRPGMTAPGKILDSGGVQNDFHTALVTFAGAPADQAKFLVEMNRRKDGNTDPQIWVGWERGGQVAISPTIPTDGGQHSLNSPFALSFDGQGQGAALLTRNGSSGSAPDRCGAPKLARGGASGAWKTCSPDHRRDQAAAGHTTGLSLVHAVNGKLYAGYAVTQAPLGPGIVLWREP